jgi:hypothetical protein
MESGHIRIKSKGKKKIQGKKLKIKKKMKKIRSTASLFI